LFFYWHTTFGIWSVASRRVLWFYIHCSLP